MKVLKFSLLLTLLAAGCMTGADKSSCEPTERIVTVHDTVLVHDTIRVPVEIDRLVTQATPGELIGAWKAEYVGRYIGSTKPSNFDLLIAFTHPVDRIDSVGSKMNFTVSRIDEANITDKFTCSGKVKSLDSGTVSIEWNFSNQCTWLLSFKGDSMWLQEIGEGFFMTPLAIEFKR